MDSDKFACEVLANRLVHVEEEKIDLAIKLEQAKCETECYKESVKGVYMNLEILFHAMESCIRVNLGRIFIYINRICWN